MGKKLLITATVVSLLAGGSILASSTRTVVQEEVRGEGVSALKRYVHGFVAHEQEVGQTFLRHSEMYRKAAGLTIEEVERLADAQGYCGMYPDEDDYFAGATLRVTVLGQTFAIVGRHVCAHHLGAGWVECVEAIARNPELNTHTGHGTTRINIIPEEYARAIVEELKK